MCIRIEYRVSGGYSPDSEPKIRSSAPVSPRWVCEGQSSTVAGFTPHLLQLLPTLSFQHLLNHHR